jgi:peptidoglycan hydrolase-like protein with peptidoglycan-binding domain
MEKNLFKDLYPKRDPKKLSTLNKINKEVEVKKVIHKNGNVNNFFKYVSISAVISLSIYLLNLNLTNNVVIDNESVSSIAIQDNKPFNTTTTIELSKTSTTLENIAQEQINTTSTTVVSYVNSLEDAQIMLETLGLYDGEIDGELDSETRAAIKKFQKLSGLVVDGILGPITKESLSMGELSYISFEGSIEDFISELVYYPEIEKAQIKLKNLKLYSAEIDGLNGLLTKSAVREFQRLSGLTTDGVLGPITLAALEKGSDSYILIDESKDTIDEKEIIIEASNNSETSYVSLGVVPTQNYTPGINSPVNGLIMSSTANNSIVIGIKNDNNLNARPQSGPQHADAVVEVLVEGGMTRFINIFYQSDTTYHGPIRSARPTDPTMLKPLGGVLVVSGATGGLIPEIVNMGVPVITDSRPEFYRISSRKAPHNLYADTKILKSSAISKGYKKTDTPQPLFPWGDPSFDNWINNSYLTLPFSGFTETTWTWNGSSYSRTYFDAYKNKRRDNIHYWSDINGNTGEILFETVIALFCEPYIHPLQLPSVKTIGEGRAVILHGGKMLDARWKRGSNSDPFHIVDSNNNILYVPKGKVWISLVPNTKNPSFG